LTLQFRISLAILALFCLGPGFAEKPGPLTQRIDTLVHDEMKKQNVPGVAVAVVHRGELVTVKGYGLANVEHNVPVTPATIFQSGSVGKQFTAAAVMLLVEDGKMALDDSITKYLPDAPARWVPITIRHLLTHISGIPNFPYGNIDMRKDHTEDELAKIAFGLPLEFEPGVRWNYSNTGYLLLGVIIHKASGRFYGELLKERVFAPIGMKTARIIDEADIVPHRAAGYRLLHGRLANQEWVSPTVNTTADGSMYISILDMVAWDQALRARAVLKPESWQQVYTPVKLKSGKSYPYGFGWSVDDFSGQRRHHHGGSWQGFKTHISRYLADDLTVIVLANLANAEPGTIAENIAALVNPKLARSDEPIADKDPAMTDRVRDLVRLTQSGKLSKNDLASVRSGFFPRAAETYRKLLEPMGELQTVQLIELRELGDDREFRYLAIFKDQRVEVTLTLDGDGKVTNYRLAKKS
jgi:CubicO group peptidase (beta-lactamase class C family)